VLCSNNDWVRCARSTTLHRSGDADLAMSFRIISGAPLNCILWIVGRHTEGVQLWLAQVISEDLTATGSPRKSILQSPRLLFVKSPRKCHGNDSEDASVQTWGNPDFWTHLRHQLPALPQFLQTVLPYSQCAELGNAGLEGPC
jgi:hypothetical protein